MKVETLRGALTVTADEGTSHYRLCDNCMEELHGLGILEARVIRTCPTCGGSREEVVHEYSTSMSDRVTDRITRPCPDCGPVYVIAPEAWEAAQMAATHSVHISISHDDAGRVIGSGQVNVGELVTAVTQALLPRARRAKGVVTVDSPAMDAEEYWATENCLIRQGDTIAILYNEQEGEDG